MKEWYCFGEFRQDPHITAEIMEQVLDEARRRASIQRAQPLDAIVEVLEEAGRRLGDPSHPIRKQALERLPELVGFSQPMVAAALDTLCDILDGQNLLRRLDCDLGEASCLDFFTYHQRFEGYIRALPRGVVAHIAAGNVFVGALDSLVQGIITKNANILKMSSDDTFFPLLFARLIAECDPEGVVTGSFALLPFKGGRQELEGLIKTRCDVVIVYGGQDAVAAYREGLGPKTKLVEYGPKYSLVVVTAEELARRGQQEVARAVARDASMWEQSACSSPHAVYVCAGEEKASRELARQFAQALARAMEEFAREYPHGKILVDEQVEITRERELAKVAQTLGEGELIIPARERQDWTVIVEYDPIFHVSPHHRTVFVKPLARLEDLGAVLAPYGEFLQSVALVATPSQALALARELGWLGADRFTEPGQMSRRKHGSPHDGTRGTAELVRWASWGRAEPFIDEFDFLDDEQRERITLARLNRLIAFCRRHSPFYRDRLPDGRLQRLEELAELPLLSPDELRAHLPPEGEGLLTAPLEGTYAFSSGGTTGAAKVIYRTVPETLYNARALAKGLRLSVFKPGDVVANLLFAGNLWASFVSFNQALELVGCHILPIAGSIGLEQVLEYLRRLKPNAAISIPSVFLSLARIVKERGITDVRITKIATGGEHLFPEAKQFLREALGVEKFASTGYTTNDTGAIAFQCECCEGGVHHIHEDLHLVEILDPHTNKPLAPGEVGKIVVTNLHRRLMPMIRYDVGDMGRIIQRPCPCGRKVRLLELLGRVDEEVRIGPARITLAMISEKIGQIEGLSQHFRIIARREGLRDQLVVEVETGGQSGEQERAELGRRLQELITRAKPEIPIALKRGEIAPVVVRVLPPESIPRNPRTGKIKQVVDERH